MNQQVVNHYMKQVNFSVQQVALADPFKILSNK
jgi:hypothetical protein